MGALQAERFFADRDFRLELTEVQISARFSYVWVDLVSLENPATTLRRYAGGKDEPTATAHTVARWHVEHGD